MADVKAIAETLVNLTVKEVQELASEIGKFSANTRNKPSFFRLSGVVSN